MISSVLGITRVPVYSMVRERLDASNCVLKILKPSPAWETKVPFESLPHSDTPEYCKGTVRDETVYQDGTYSEMIPD